MQQQLVSQILDSAVFYFCYFSLHLLLFKVLMLFLNRKWSAHQFPKSDSHNNDVPNVCARCNSCMLEEVPARPGGSSEYSVQDTCKSRDDGLG